MPRIVFLISVLALVAAVFAQRWFGRRVHVNHRSRQCKADVGRWRELFGEASVVPEGEVSAVDLGKALRTAALESWRNEDPGSCKGRDASRRFGVAVPPLTILVVVFAVVMVRIQMFPALAIILAATALACGFGLLSIGSELRAVARAARKVRERRVFTRSDDEDAVIDCAAAEVWVQALPPIMRFIG